MPLISCPDCKKQVSTEAIACPNCGRPIKRSAIAAMPSNDDRWYETLDIKPGAIEETSLSSATANATQPPSHGRVCPHCGSHAVGKVRGVQGIGEVLLLMILIVAFFIPGIVYYVYIESIPYCSGCGRRIWN